MWKLLTLVRFLAFAAVWLGILALCVVARWHYPCRNAQISVKYCLIYLAGHFHVIDTNFRCEEAHLCGIRLVLQSRRFSPHNFVTNMSTVTICSRSVIRTNSKNRRCWWKYLYEARRSPGSPRLICLKLNNLVRNLTFRMLQIIQDCKKPHL